MRPQVLFTAATASYLANCALGAAVKTRLLRTDDVRWVHHGLFVITSTLAGGAVSSVLWSRSRAGWLLLPATVPFALIPRRSARTRGHVLLALSAAPFFAASLVAARAETTTRIDDRGEQRA